MSALQEDGQLQVLSSPWRAHPQLRDQPGGGHPSPSCQHKPACCVGSLVCDDLHLPRWKHPPTLHSFTGVQDSAVLLSCMRMCSYAFFGVQDAALRLVDGLQGPAAVMFPTHLESELMPY